MTFGPKASPCVEVAPHDMVTGVLHVVPQADAFEVEGSVYAEDYQGLVLLDVGVRSAIPTRQEGEQK